MARFFIPLYVLMGIYVSVSAQVEVPGALNISGQLTKGSIDVTEAPSNISQVQKRQVSNGLRPTTSNCGGYVELSSTSEIFYQIPPGVQMVSCIWVVWAKTGGAIRIRNDYNKLAQFGSTFKLGVEYNFTLSSSWKWDVPLGYERLLNFGDTNRNFIYVLFSGKPTREQQGIHLKLSTTGSSSTATVGFRPKVQFIQHDSTNGLLKYPPGSKPTYDNNERVFMIGYVPEGKSLDITVQSDLEQPYDFFAITFQSGQTLTQTNYRTTGVGISSKRTIPAGTSYVMAFITDGSQVRTGVRLSYFTYVANAASK